MESQPITKKVLPTILIVDSNSASLDEIVKDMESQGYCVYTEQNGEAGLQRAGIVHPDIILLNVRLLAIDGLEVCRRLKKQIATRDIPVVFMEEPTGGMSKGICFEVGAVDYLSKPLQLDEVIACVETQFNLSSMQKRLEMQNAQLLRYREQLEQRVAERTRELNESNQRLRKEIQERKLMEDQLRLKEFVLDHASDAVYLIDRTPIFVYVNEEASRALGYSRDELLGMGPFDIDPSITPQDTQRFRMQMQATGSFSYESSHRRRDGSLFPVEIRGALIEYQGQLMSFTLARDITERKRAEETLAAREREFRTLAENAPDNIARHDRHCRFVYINPQHDLTLGIAAGEVIGKTPEEINPGNSDLAKYQARMRAVIETGQPDEFAAILPDIGGGVRYHNIRLVAERDEQGEIVGTLAIGRDMTEYKRIEQAVMQSEAALRSLTDSAPFAIIRYDIESRITYVNAPLLGFFGIPLAELIGRLPSEVWPDGRFVKIDQGIAQVRETKTEVVVEFSELIAEGKTLHHQVWVVPEKDSLNEMVGIIAFGLDITERKSMEDKLSASEREFRTLAENMPDNIIRYNRQGLPLYINPALERTLGAEAAAMMGKTPREYHSDGSYEDYAQLLDAVLTSGEAGEFEKILTNPDGTTCVHQIRMVPECGENGELMGVLAIGRDITERKRADFELEETRTQLRGLIAHREEAREEERKLIAREVHDELGQILSGLKLNVALVEEKCAAHSEALREHFSESMILIDSSIGVARNIVSTLRPIELDMGIVASLEWLVNRFATYSGVQCETHIADRELRLQEDCAVALFRIVQESLTNVAKHAQADKLSISLTRDGGDCVLKVRDNGVGFDTSAKKINSFGLVGIRERTLKQGGTLSINSRIGDGTEIVVRIPLKENRD